MQTVTPFTMERMAGTVTDSRLETAKTILREAVAERAFPGASFCVTFRGETLLGSVGRTTYEPNAPAISAEMVYDLASLTKVLATTALAMKLYESGLLRLDQPVRELVHFDGGGDDPRRATVTVRHLLAHSSGLPAYLPMYKMAQDRAQAAWMAALAPLECEPGTRAEYSDVGFIVLGALLEKLAGETLDRSCERQIFAPLGMKETCFNPPREWRRRIPPTEIDSSFRKTLVWGTVHDENAHVMRGVAGHAGLFGTARDVATFAEVMLRGGTPLFKRGTVELFTQRQPPEGSSRALGWDTPSPSSSSGKHFSPRSYGHLGFTGTSLWIDPERQLSVTLLSNRTWPDRSSQRIKQVRPAFHDAIVEALDR